MISNAFPKQNRDTEGCSKLKSPETRQVQEGLQSHNLGPFRQAGINLSNVSRGLQFNSIQFYSGTLRHIQIYKTWTHEIKFGTLTDTAMLISELTRFDSFYIFFRGTPRVFTM